MQSEQPDRSAMSPVLQRRYIAEGEGLAHSTSPISQAVVAGNHCYVSGQLAVDAAGVFQSGTVAEECAQAFRNLSRALDIAGFHVADIVFLDVALTDLSQIAEVNKQFVTWFDKDSPPARTVYQASALPYGGKVKLYAVAIARS